VYFEDRDSFRLNANTRNVHAAGALTWKPLPRSAFGFEYVLTRSMRPPRKARADALHCPELGWRSWRPSSFSAC
jgi:hypothetical protein